MERNVETTFEDLGRRGLRHRHIIGHPLGFGCVGHVRLHLPRKIGMRTAIRNAGSAAVNIDAEATNNFIFSGPQRSGQRG